MRRTARYFILNILFLFIASQFSYAMPKDSINKTGEEIQNEYPSPIMITPYGRGGIKEMPLLNQHPCLSFPNLNLDEKQKKALKAIENNTTKELIRKKADEQIAEIELWELLNNDIVDLKAVEIKIKQIAIIKTETLLFVIKSMEEMKEKLTLEQRVMLKKYQPMDCQIKPPLKRKMTPDDPPFTGEKEKRHH